MRTRLRGSLSIGSSSELIFGRAPHPVPAGQGLVIGGGAVYPEINFTLPPMSVDEARWGDVRRQYQQMIDGLVEHAVGLDVPGLVVEFEQLPPMTERADWGAEITALLREALDKAKDQHGLASALRVTIVDLRDGSRPPRLREGPHWEAMIESWRKCARSGADILSIESVGGKEVHDRALLFGDVPGIVYSLGVLASRDMEWLWGELVKAAVEEGAVPGGDSACGFANTAMQLAQQRQLPEVLAAVVRALSAPRSLVAFECGAVGPSKDCAYEGPVLKMLTGCPISMEGKSSACAHFSPLGNIASCAADLWSNESVQNVRLLSGSAPRAFLEILAYDCRLMNRASEKGQAEMLRDLLAESDEFRSPQALILGLSATERIARSILAHPEDDYRRTLEAGRVAVALIREACAEEREDSRRLRISPQESRWLDRIDAALQELPEDAGDVVAALRDQYADAYDPASYGL